MAEMYTWDDIHYLQPAGSGDLYVVTIGLSLETILGIIMVQNDRFLAQTKPETKLTWFDDLAEAGKWVVATQRKSPPGADPEGSSSDSAD